MTNRIIFWLNNSRLFSLPMTFMSWIVIFIYSLNSGGSIINGLLALIGISSAHLATNLFDDYVDYKTLCKNPEFVNNTVKTKCDYIKNGTATLQELLLVVMIYCLIALIIGVILTIKCGLGVILLALTGGIITLTYAFWSSYGFSELAVGIAFGPLLFEGVYFVMCGRFSFEVFILSLAVVSFTIGLLYTHNLLDYDGDVCADKKTLCCRFGNKNKALRFLFVLYCFGYLMCFVLAYFSRNLFYVLPALTFPFAILHYVSMQMYIRDKNNLPPLRWWNYPLEGWQKIAENNTGSFYFRLYQARNLMVWFSLLMIMAVLTRNISNL